jgi:hypothetical protein
MPLVLKWVLTVIVIIAPPAGDAFNFSQFISIHVGAPLMTSFPCFSNAVVDLQSYPGNMFAFLVTIGLFIIRKKRVQAGLPRTQFRTWNALVFFCLAVNVFVLVAPWVPPEGGLNAGDVSFFYATYCIVGIAM